MKKRIHVHLDWLFWPNAVVRQKYKTQYALDGFELTASQLYKRLIQLERSHIWIETWKNEGKPNIYFDDRVKRTEKGEQSETKKENIYLFICIHRKKKNWIYVNGAQYIYQLE